MSECPEPGIYPGVSFEEYFAWDAMNASTLKIAAERTLLHARQEQLRPLASTPTQVLGQAIHCCILEPALFKDQYAEGLELPNRKNVDKEAHREHAEKHAGKEILKPAEWKACFEMRKAAFQTHGDVAALLAAAGTVEVCLVWDDPETGVRCKARLDKLTTFGEWPVIADLKSCPSAAEAAFGYDCWKFRYDLQAAFYLDGANTLAPRDRLFLFLAMEKDPPYASRIHELGPDSVQTGRIDYKRVLRNWKQAVKTGVYPGYPPGICPNDIPKSRIRTAEEF